MALRSRFFVTALLALGGGAGCGSRIASVPPGSDAGGGSTANTFPVGTYTNCAQGSHTQSGPFLNVAGFESGAALTLTQNGTTVTAAYVDENGAQSTFDFSAATSTYASLASPTQSGAVSAGQCVHGPGNVGNYPAKLTANEGTLTYEANTAFVTLVGTLEADAGSCGPLSAPGTFWIACGGGPDAPPPPPSNGGTGVGFPQLPLGSYACVSQVEAHDGAQTNGAYVSSGGESGTLTLSQSGPQVSAEYDGDKAIAGTVLLSATTSDSAIAHTGQSMNTPCLVPIDPSGGLPPPTPAPLSVGAASLGVFDSTLLMPFYGTMGDGATCSGAQMAGSLICTKQ
jgi:hypothetical protein